MTRRTTFFEEWSSFKFNNLGLTLGTNLKFYTSFSKGLKLKVLGAIPTFVEVIREKLVGGPLQVICLNSGTIYDICGDSHYRVFVKAIIVH